MSKLINSSNYVWMWELDHKVGWAPKNWCFWTMLLEKTLDSPLDSKEIKLVNPKGNQPWIFIGRTDAEAETSILWPPDAKSQLIGKDHDAGKGWGQEEKGMTEDEIVGWHHRFNGHEFEQTQGDSKGQRSLACYSSWGRNWTTANTIIQNIFTGLKLFYALPIHLFHPPLLATTDLLSASIALPFTEYHIVRIKKYIAFSDWLLSLGNMHLRFFHVFSWLDDSFPLRAE